MGIIFRSAFLCCCLRFLFVLPAYSTEQNNKEKEPIFTWGFYFHEIVTLGKYSSATIYPIIGLKPVDRLALGTSFKYRYSNSPTYAAHDYALAPYISYIVSRNVHQYFPFGLLIHGEYEMINYDKHGQYDKRHDVHLAWAGVGINQSFGNYNSLNFLLLFELTGHQRATKSPAFRISLLF